MIKKKLLLTFTLIAITISGFSQTAEEYYDRAVEKCTWENYRGAIKDLNKSIDLKPSEDAYKLRGLAKMKKGNPDTYAAIKDFDKAIFVNDSSETARINRGIAYLKLGEYKKAEEDFTKAIEVNPNRMSGYKGRVKARQGLNDLAGANADAKVIENLRGGETIVANGTMSSEEVTDIKDEPIHTEDNSKVVSMDSFNGMEVRKTIEIDMRDFVPAQKEINLAGQQLLNARRTFVVGFLLNIGGAIMMASTAFTDNQKTRVGLGVAGAITTTVGGVVMLTAAIPIGGAGKILKKIEFPQKVSIPVR